jgi:hypothetical protein
MSPCLPAWITCNMSFSYLDQVQHFRTTFGRNLLLLSSARHNVELVLQQWIRALSFYHLGTVLCTLPSVLIQRHDFAVLSITCLQLDESKTNSKLLLEV